MTAERRAGGTEQEVAGGAHTAADDKHPWVEGRRQVGDTEPEPVADVGEKFDRESITLACRLGDQRPGEEAGIAADPLG